MKLKKKHYILLAAAVILVMLVLTVVLKTGNRLKESELLRNIEYATADDSGFQEVKEGEVRLENEQMLLTLDVATTHFTVLDKTTGESYSSVAPVGEEAKGGLYSSEVAVDYYNSDSLLKTMYSTDNCVGFGSFEVKASEDAIRVYYEIRESEKDIFVPAVFTKEVFEDEILGKLGAGQKRRIVRYYKLRNAKDNADLVSTYPELKNQELYIAIDSMNATDQKEVTGYFETLGYTPEDYAEDTADMDISEVEYDLPAKFLVPIEYRLTENGFTVDVLSDKITSASDEYILSEVRVLPMFGSVAEVRDGYLLVPDGSGALISLKEQTDASYNVRVYGIDESVDKELTLQVTQKTVMPVYGMNRGDSGFFAIIEGAAECATVRSQVLGASNLSSAVYAGFLLRSVDDTDIAQYSATTSYNIYAKEPVSGIPSVRYVLLGEENCDYSSMAKVYREYLVEEGILTERLKEGLPLYLDFTGYVTEDATFLGLPYRSKVLLSTVENMDAAIVGLQEDGITDISVRLKGYSYGGMGNAMMDSFKVTSDVGSTKELKAFAERLRQNGGTLYIEDAVGAVYEDSRLDRFNKMTHAAMKINRMVARRGDFNIVLQGTNYVMNPYYMISPRYYEALVENFAASFGKKMGSAEGYGYSWSGYGSRLIGDYRRSDTIDRTEARMLADAAVSKAEGFDSIMTEGGYMYAVAHADTILNVPLSDSSYRVVTEGVPFYSMVVHGYKNYAGVALNLATDAETEWLKTIESGASMYYSCMTEDYTKIKNLNYRQTIYPISEELCQDEIVSRYQEYADVFARLATQVIDRHEITKEGIHLTIYEDGTIIAVNYESRAISWNGITVEARSFAVAQQQEEQP